MAEITPTHQPIDLNEQFRHALDIMENTDRNIFILPSFQLFSGMME